MRATLILLLVLSLAAFASSSLPGENYILAVKRLSEIRSSKKAITKEIEALRDATGPEQIAQRNYAKSSLEWYIDFERRTLEFVKIYEARLDLKRPCPFCGGKLVAVGSVKNDKSRPAKNDAVWPRYSIYMCGNPFLRTSPICKECWAAQSIESDAWVRRTTRKTFMGVPREAPIQNFPLPPAKIRLRPVTFSQVLAEGERVDSISMDMKLDAGYLKTAREFAQKNGLHLSVHDGETVRSLWVSTKLPEEPKATTEPMEGVPAPLPIPGVSPDP